MSRAAKRGIIISAVVLFIIAAVCIGLFDREISEAYFKTASRYGGFFEVAGEPPAILLSLYCFNVLAASDRRRGWQTFWTVFSVGVWAYFINKLCVSFRLGGAPLWALVAAGAALEALSAVCFCLWMKKRHAAYLEGEADEALEAFCSRCALAAVACVFTLVSVSALKALWGRVRPRDVGVSGEFGFFWVPLYFSGNRTFPWGPTGNAATLGALVFFIDSKKARIIFWLAVAVWIGAVALSRVRGGAHFPTDVLFGAAFGLFGVFISPKLAPRVYPESKKLLKSNGQDPV
ncbi:MAG: phosphatase PAP2 family protein [Clostridia bacterium]|nr:phosphatase PAP2 family protein [Clostridia bacterium]